jgi:beta-lactamase superfamily II metal-dependent hydrolase
MSHVKRFRHLRAGAGALLALWLCTGAARAQRAGEVVPPWSPGGLDIHHINTGKGDAAFFILPDGTTLLVDAGATLRPGPRVTPQKPDDSRTPGQWIARYIQHSLQGRPARVDYAVLTHFHGDHMGEIGSSTKDSAAGPYKLAGITEVAEIVPVRTLLDRGWPDYNYPVPLADGMMQNYRSFLKWQVENKGLRVERFQPGRNDQIALLAEPQKYPQFEIRNIAANGEIWTGVAANTRRHFPSLEDLPKSDWPSENMCSIAFRLSYGKFDYFTGGDMPGGPDEASPAWHDIETPVAAAVGPVEVHVLNHHGFHDAANAYFVSTLRPRVHILSVYAPSQPGQRVLNRLLSTRLYPGPRDIFATNIMEENKIVIGEALARLKSDQGHVLVRVAPGGDRYQVIILDDSAETYRVKAVHGPYESR